MDIEVMKEMWRQRQDLHRSEKGLTLRIKAKCRRLCDGDKTEAEKLYKAIFGKGTHNLGPHAAAVCAPFINARSLIEDQRKLTEKTLEKMAKELPVWKNWAKDVKGIGPGSVAAIVGECGDLSNYLTVSRVWKRMGLAVINGERQRKKQGVEALEHGYSPTRRSVMWTIGDSMFRCGGKYADLLRKRKEFEIEKAEKAGLTVLPAAKITDKNRETSMSQGHVHNRAKRYMEKQLLKDMWLNWK